MEIMIIKRLIFNDVKYDLFLEKKCFNFWSSQIRKTQRIVKKIKFLFLFSFNESKYIEEKSHYDQKILSIIGENHIF